MLVYYAKSCSFNYKSKGEKSGKGAGKIKEFTAKKILKSIKEHPKESRKEWKFWMFARAGTKSSNVSGLQFGNIIINRSNCGVQK